MLLHASRLVVPRGAKPTIDVTAPLPERFGRVGGGDRGPRFGQLLPTLRLDSPVSDSPGSDGHAAD